MSGISRRKLITTGIVSTAGVSGIAAAARIAGDQGLIPPDWKGLYGCGHTLTYAAHRLLTSKASAREFARDQISAIPHPKGDPPEGAEFSRLKAGGFKEWRLQVDGLVDRPHSFSIDELKSYPVRSQITQLICEEGWSYIAEWTGVPLSEIVAAAAVSPRVRFAVYYSMDGWVDAIDIDEARHAQTVVAYGMNSGDLPVGHGGPLRMRVPKQLGYKSVKFLNRVAFAETLKGLPIGGEYSWYAGI